jgi:23S rRNA pseudouridine1911/1915/1917 synthase
VIDKPPGLVVHPAASLRETTLVHALLSRYPEMAEMIDADGEDRLRPGIVHRLDRDTSGLIVIARHRDARSKLQRQFREREVDKGYLALVYGRVRASEGCIALPIGRDPRNRQRMAAVPDGREAITEYSVRQYLFTPHGNREHYTLVDVHPLTGRTHQIRVHLAHVGHAVVGDRVYGRRKRRLASPRQFLHACRLGFYRPSDGEWVCFRALLPVDLEGVLSQLRPVV